MTVTQANALNTLLRHLAGRPLHSYDRAPTDRDDFGAAVQILIAGAHKTLMAGVSINDVPNVIETITGRLTAADSDGHAQTVCRALAEHEQHGGSIPWPSIRRPYDEWKALR